MLSDDPGTSEELAYTPTIGLILDGPDSNTPLAAATPPPSRYDYDEPSFDDSAYVDPQTAQEIRSAWNLQGIAKNSYRTGDYAQARTALLRSLGIFQQVGHKEGQAWAYTNLGKVAYRQHSLTEARSYLQSGIDIFRAEADKKGEALVTKPSSPRSPHREGRFYRG